MSESRNVAKALDALRLADALARVEAGYAPDLDPNEDPALCGLLATASDVRGELSEIHDGRAFHSFHTRSRAAIIHTLEVDFAPARVRVRAMAKVAGQTGVEMEALTAVSVACLTIYDMVKAVDRFMRIEGVGLVEKSGGKSGHWKRDEA